MAKHYDVYNIRSNEVTEAFDLQKDAELWIAEQEHPEDYEIIPVEVFDAHPMNLFLSK